MQVLFIHGAGEGAHKEDKLLAESLQHALGPDYDVHCPEMPDEANAPYDLWKRKIGEWMAATRGPFVVVGHSMGGSYLAKILAETKVTTPIAGIFLLNAPFWGGDGWRYEGYEELELPRDLAGRFPAQASVFLYHTRDDEIVPFGHLALYARLLPQAAVREIDRGGHQMGNELSSVARDIQSIRGGK